MSEPMCEAELIRTPFQFWDCTHGQLDNAYTLFKKSIDAEIYDILNKKIPKRIQEFEFNVMMLYKTKKDVERGQKRLDKDLEDFQLQAESWSSIPGIINPAIDVLHTFIGKELYLDGSSTLMELDMMNMGILLIPELYKIKVWTSLINHLENFVNAINCYSGRDVVTNETYFVRPILTKSYKTEIKYKTGIKMRDFYGFGKTET